MLESIPISRSCEEICSELATRLEAKFVFLLSLDAETKDLNFHCGSDASSNPLTLGRIGFEQLPRIGASLLKHRVLRVGPSGGEPDRGNLTRLIGNQPAYNFLLVPASRPDESGDLAALLLREDEWGESDFDEVILAMQDLRVDELPLLDSHSRADFSPKVTVDTETELDFGASEQPFINFESKNADYGADNEVLGDTHAQAFTTSPAQDSKILRQLESENEQFRHDLAQLLEYVDGLKAQDEGVSATQRNGRESELVSELQRENEELHQALTELERFDNGMGKRPTIDAEQAKEELRLALEEVATLYARLDAAQQAVANLDDLEPATNGGKIPAEKAEIIASIAQELRQPLSSVLGYTDLLLSESVGILGALQRSFLERVRTSTDRMDTLIEDLIHIAELDTAGVEIMRKPVDLSEVMDDAINMVRDQLQEKRIVLRVDLPQQLPELQTDQDALQQVLLHLLQNADAATPAEGEITLRAFVEREDDLGEFVLIQVSDTGGGIPENDLSRVFSRVYRAQNPIIQGVGDTGVGLTIAETLTEALGGRIWVESEEGVGARFSILLPLSPASPSQQ